MSTRYALGLVVGMGLSVCVAIADVAVGSWWWANRDLTDEKATSAKLDFLTSQGATEVYVRIDWQLPTDEIVRFVRRAKAKGLAVSCLSGDASWIRPGNLGFEELFAKYRHYQRIAPKDARFVSLHLDVEPHVDHELSDTRKWQLYVDFFLRAMAMARRSGEKVEWDIPFWLDNVLVHYGVREAVPLLEVLMDHADGVVLMSYRDTAPIILDCAKTELELGKTRRCRVLLGVETAKSDEGETVSFYEKGRAHLEQELSTVKQAVSATGLKAGGGVAVHHVDSWIKLKD